MKSKGQFVLTNKASESRPSIIMIPEELGHWLAEPFWGKGIMTQAIKRIISHGIRTLKLQRIFAEPYTINPASASVLEKAGFICEGIMRSNAFKDGKTLDQFLYSYVTIED